MSSSTATHSLFAIGYGGGYPGSSCAGFSHPVYQQKAFKIASFIRRKFECGNNGVLFDKSVQGRESMIKKAFLTELFRAADMRRWNDKIRHVELRELDHQAHKMAVAYILGRYEELENPGDVDWIILIERGIFEFLERLVLTDIKPQVRREIQKHEDKYRQLRAMVFEHFEFMLPDFDGFEDRFKQYLSASKNHAKLDTNAKILDAAGFCATIWEWHLIEQPNKEDYEVSDIIKRFEKEWRKYDDLQGISPFKRTKTPYDQIKGFVDLCGILRFQERWSHLYRVPRTSVLGHMLIVAILSVPFLFEDRRDAQNQRMQ